ncbi:MAG: hypothetical protein ACLGIV_16090 [Actinomycetes bacterium]
MTLLARSRADLALAVTVMAWIAVVLWLDRSGPMAEQVLLGVLTWGLLVGLLRRETPLVRAQTVIVVVLATVVEYTFSPLLEAYTYRLETVPAYVPPGHGLVYLAALALGRSALFQHHRRLLVAATVAAGGAWAVHGVTLAERHDALGAFWFVCLLGFLAWGRSRMLYVGAFVVVSALEIAGTAWGTWQWAERDPLVGLVTQGNPPSGAAGGYGWFDLWALLLAPVLLRAWSRSTRRPRVGCRPSARRCDESPHIAAPTVCFSACERP